MQGKILDYNSEFKSGLIRGEDGNKYRFSIDDCKSDLKPRPNAEVDFEPNGDKAVEVYVMTKDTVDDLKDVASSAVNATASAVIKSTSIFKRIIPILLILGIIGGASIFISQVVIPHQNEQNHQKLLLEGDELFKESDYQGALEKYESANVFFEDNSFSDDYWFNSYERRRDHKMAECYLAMNKPQKALSLIGNPPDSKTLGYADNPLEYGVQTEQNANACILASKIYKQIGDHKIAKVYADWACKAGDCSLVEK